MHLAWQLRFISLASEDAHTPEVQQAIEMVNDRFAGHLRVVPSGRSTHFFDATLTVLYLDFLTLLFREKRKAVREITGEDYENLGGCLLWDAFPGARQKSLGPLRDKWAEEVDGRPDFSACVHCRLSPPCSF